MDDESVTPDPLETAHQIILGEVVNSRAVDAYKYKRQGRSLRWIANELGYEDSRQVSQAIAEELKREAEVVSAEERGGILHLENDRLDELQATYYESATLGDFKSLDAVMKIMAHRAKINKLDAIDTQTQQHTVLVIGGAEDEYVQKLKELD